MKKVYGYIRVSTVKQGTGVSLQEQKEAIIRYAEKHQLNIIQWFEEKETAAKHGRPLFNQMMKLLKNKKVHGVVFHKIDRGSRNYKDWAAIDELIVSGIELHFAHESLDMNTRAGRLTADMLQALATDYIRNLREEASKGLYGRLKQGIWPFDAPIGYINHGKGKVKTIDTTKGPLVRKAFELYATKKYTLATLTVVINKYGLRNRKGNSVSVQGLSKIFNNPFYAGVLKVKGKTFQGKHETLVSPKLYREVQEVLNGKTNAQVIKNDFVFRKLIKCAECSYSLIGETKKGHIYYRCHTKTCPTKGIREEIICNAVNQTLDNIKFNEDEEKVMNELLDQAQLNWEKTHSGLVESLQLLRSKLELKFQRLTDAYIESVIDKRQFEEKKEQLMLEQEELKISEGLLESQKTAIFKKTKNFLGLLKRLVYIDKIAETEEKRKILKFITSDISVQLKKPMITMLSPFYEIANRSVIPECGHERVTPRTKLANVANFDYVVDNVETCNLDYNNTNNTSQLQEDDTALRERMQNLFNLILQYCQSVESLEVNEDELL